jgi:hypothetical protein
MRTLDAHMAARENGVRLATSGSAVPVAPTECGPTAYRMALRPPLVIDPDERRDSASSGGL